MGAGMSQDADPVRLTEGLGSRWAVIETSIKFHASCRHTHPAADALLHLVTRHNLGPADIARITARVYQAAADVLGVVDEPRTVHQSKFCMGFVLALIAAKRRAGIEDFDEAALSDAQLADLRRRVLTVVDAAIDTAYPARWSSAVEVVTRDGRTLSATCEVPKGDPGNRLSRAELEDKVLRLAAWGRIPEDAMGAVMQRVWRLEAASSVGWVLPSASASVADFGNRGEKRAQGKTFG